MLCLSASSLAAGVTLRTFTPFADVDFAAQSYMDLVTTWETQTGNMVEDYSGMVDDMWMEQLKGITSVVSYHKILGTGIPDFFIPDAVKDMLKQGG